jgi:hypothetical protein
MKRVRIQIFCAIALSSSGLLEAQFNQFNINGQTIQVHGFASQGYALSNQNNYLTMDTSKGSFAFTDGGLNISTNIGDKIHVGAQGYIRDIGQLGGGRFTLDWAFVDYRFKDWFGIRAGKVKTPLGLFNDTQDAESLHTWALLPQSIYPTDLRSTLIAHTGGDVYGEISLKGVGSVGYAAYVGQRPNDRRSGYYFNTQDTGVPVETWTGVLSGGDVHWNTPVSGLLMGYSFLNESDNLTGKYPLAGDATYYLTTAPQHVNDVYLDYTHGKFRFNTEFRRNTTDYNFKLLGSTSHLDFSNKGWFATASYRVASRLEVGAYNSRLYVDHPQTPEPAANHIFDQAVTLRYDLTKWWNVKVEGHFIDGYGDLYSAHGFYLRSNPQGTKPTTDLLIVRTGFYF